MSRRQNKQYNVHVLEAPYEEKYGLLIQINFGQIKRNNEKVKFLCKKKVNNTFQGNGHQHQ
jgi:hypothetical protein